MSEPRILRLEPHQMANITVVVRCSGIRRWRYLASLWLMKVAGRVGGFKNVKFVWSGGDRPDRHISER